MFPEEFSTLVLDWIEAESFGFRQRRGSVHVANLHEACCLHPCQIEANEGQTDPWMQALSK